MREQRLEILTIMMRYPQISEFIRNGWNKDTLYHCLAARFIYLLSSTTQILVVTYKDAILKTQDVPDDVII